MKRQNSLILLLFAISVFAVAVAFYSLRKARFAIEQAQYAIKHGRRNSDITRELNLLVLQEQQKADLVKRKVSLLKLSKIIENSFLSADQNTFAKAIKIRNIIYSQVPIKVSPENFNFMEFDSCFLRSTRDETIGHICGGLAILYISALESQGIPARLVCIFSKDVEPSDSHVTVEFWHNGKWHASDPTFNVMYTYKGQYLSYSELYERCRQMDHIPSCQMDSRFFLIKEI